MAGKGREVADAYIEVHGDLSKFRKDLMKAKASAREAGEKYGDEFADGFQKRASDGIRKDKDSIIDAIYSGNTVDWDRAFGQFDSKNLDEAKRKMLDFMNDMKETGVMSGEQFEAVSEKVEEAARSVDAASDAERRHNLLVSDGRKVKMAAALEYARQEATKKALIASSREELDRFNRSFDGMKIASEDRIFEKNWRRLHDFMSGADVGPNLKSIQDTEKFKAEMLKTAEAARTMGRAANGEFGHMQSVISKIIPEIDGVNTSLDTGGKKTGIMSRLTSKMQTSWARMDGTVRMVISLIAAASGPMAAGLSGLAAGGTGLVSSLALAAAAAIPLGAAMVGVGVAIALAATAMKDMKKQFPGINKGIKEIDKAWSDQAKSFGKQWGPALSTFLQTFADKLAKYDFGTPMGKAVSEVTKAFTGVLNSPGFDALMKALSTDLPKAVEGFGKGLAGMVGGLSSLLAGAAPVAAQLGKDFEGWGEKFSASMESMRKSGKLQEVFEKARESLLAVLDLTGSLGSALGTVFMTGADSGNRMLTTLTGLVDKWNAWMKTDAGQKAMLEWFENGERIVKSFKPVIVGLAEALDKLVTPHSITQFENLMKSVGGLLPILADLLLVVSNLGILNIIADLFLMVGEAIQPLLGPLGEITKSLGKYLSDAVKALKPMLEAIGKALLPMIEGFKKIVDIVGPVLAPAIEKISAALTPVITVIGEIAGVIMDVLAPILGTILVGIINNVVGVISGLAGVFNGLVEIVKGAFGIIVGIFTGDGQLILDSVGQVFGGVWDVIKGAFEAIWNGVQLILIGKIFVGIKGFLSPLKGLFSGTFNGIKTGISTVWNGINTFFKTIWGGIKTTFSTVTSAIKTGVTTVMNGIKTFLSTIWNGISTFFGTILSKIKGTFTTVFTAVKTKVSEIFNAVKTKITEVLTAVYNTVVSKLNSVKSFFSTTFNTVKTNVATIIGAVRDKIASTLTGIYNTVVSKLNSVKSFFSSAWSAVNGTVRTYIGAVKTNVTNTLSSVYNTVVSKLNSVKGYFTSAWSNIKKSVSDGMGRVKDAVSSGISNVLDNVRNLPGKVLNSLSNVGSLLYNSGYNMMVGFINGISSMARRITDTAVSIVRNGVNAVKNFLGIRSPSKLMKKFGGWTGEGFALGMDGEGKNVKSSALGLAEIAIGQFDMSKMTIAGKDAAKGFADGLKNGEGIVQGALGKLASGAVPIPVATVPAFGTGPSAITGDAGSGNGKSVVIEAGAIVVETPATDGGIVAEQMLDQLVTKIGG